MAFSWISAFMLAVTQTFFSRENMRNQLPSFAAAALIAGFVPFVQAQTSTQPLSPKAQYAADSKQASARYKGDQKLCNDEPDTASRMQCKRDAKAEYDKAMAAAKARMTAAGPTVPTQPALAQPVCVDCGKVVSVHQTEREGEGSAVGLIAGGVAGAVLGRQVGGGFGRDLATVAGAAGGAYAGKEIEKKVKTHKVWTVGVKYPNGATSNFDFAKDPGFKVGDTVRNSDKTIVRH